jgi:hypothetical protein
MLEVDYFLSSWSGTLTLEAIDSEHSQDVTIWSGNHVLFEVEAILLYYLLEGTVNIWVSSQVLLYL